MVFIDDGATRRRAIAGIADQRLEQRAGCRDAQILAPDADAEQLFHPRAAIDHQARGLKDLEGLFLRSGSGVHLRAEFAVGRQHVIADAAGKQALAVFPRNVPVGFAVPPQPRFPIKPAENRAQAEALPGLQHNLLPPLRPVAFGVRQEFNEAARMRRRVRVEDIREVQFGPVIDIALASQLHPFAGRDFARHDGPRILMRDRGIVAIS